MAYPFLPRRELQQASEIIWSPPRTQTRIRPLPAKRRASAELSRRQIEPIEPRLLLSADHLVSIAAIQEGFSGTALDDTGIIDAIDYLLENDENFSPLVPGLRFSAPMGDNLNPMIHELFALNVDVDHNGELPDRSALIATANSILGAGTISAPGDASGIYDALQALGFNTQSALSLMDMNDDGQVSFGEAADIVITAPIVDFLQQFPSTNFDGGTNPATTMDQLFTSFVDLNGFHQGFVSFLNGLSEPTDVSSVLNLDFSGTSRVGTSGFVFETTLNLDFSNDWLLDLGFAAEQLEIGAPTESFLSGAISPLPLVGVDAGFSMSFTASASTGGSSFAFLPDGDLEFTVDANQDLAGYTVNVGFLGMEAETGNFTLELPFTAALIDPSSPEHLGFTDGSFAAGGDGEITNFSGTLTASDALTDFNILYDVIFEISLGNGTGAGELDPVEITLPAGDYTDEAGLEAALQGLVDLTSLSGVVDIGFDGSDHLRLQLLASDSAPLGYSSQNIYAASGTLTAANALDFSGNFSINTFLIIGYDGGQATRVNISASTGGAANEADRRMNFLNAVNADLAAAGLSDVTAQLNGSDQFQLTTGSEPLEITRTISMSADYNIMLDEMREAADNNFANLFDVDIDPSNDNFSITMNLDAKAGLTVVDGDLDDLDVEITSDLVQDDGSGGYTLFDGIVETTDWAGYQRVDLGDQLAFTPNDGDLDHFLNFAVLGPAEVINVISQLRGLAERLPNTDMLGGYDIPFLDSVIGENIDFSKLIKDLFIFSDGGTPFVKDDPTLGLPSVFNDDEGIMRQLLDDDGNLIVLPWFGTVQELGERLDDLGLMDAADDPVYRYADRELVYEVSANLSLLELDPPDADFALDLGPLGSISVETGIEVDSFLSFNTFLGFDLSSSSKITLTGPGSDGVLFDLDDLNAEDGVGVADYLAVTGASDVARIEGRLSADAHFAVQIEGNPAVLVTVTEDSTIGAGDENFTTAHLIADINEALATAGIGGSIQATEIGGRIVLEGLGGVDDFAVFVTETAIAGLTGFGDAAYTELGLRDSSAVTVSLVGEAIADVPSLSGNTEFEIVANGTISDTITISLDDANTVNDLIDRINAEIADGGLAGLVAAYRSGQSIAFAGIDASVFVFSVDVNAGASDDEIGLPTSPEVAGIRFLGDDFVEANPDNLGLQFGRLTGNAVFSVDLHDGNGPIIVTVDATLTEANTSVADLVNVINDSLATAGIDHLVVAEQAALGQIALHAISPDVTQIEITEADAQLGLSLGSAVATLRSTAATFAPAYFGPSSDAHFDLIFDTGSGDETVAVTIDALEARDNGFVFQLVNDVNRALNDALGADKDLFAATFDGQRLVIRASHPSVLSFRIEADDGDTAIDELKLYDFDTAAELESIPAGNQIINADKADLLIHQSDGMIRRVSVADDATLADVVASIEAASDVTVGLNPTETGLSLTDGSYVDGLAGQELFRVESVNGSKAVFGLGIHGADVQRILDKQFGSNLEVNEIDGVIVGDEIGKLDFEDRLFLEQVDDGGDLLPVFAVDLLVYPSFSGDSAISANFGFVGVELEGSGVLHLQLGIDLAQPQVTLAELFDALSTDANGDGTRDVFDLATVLQFPKLEVDPSDSGLDNITLAASLAAGVVPDGFTLGGGAQIVLTLLDAGNPFNITPTFDAAADVGADEISIAGHGFIEGSRVIYRDGGGTPVGGLSDGGVYYVHHVDDNTLQLAASVAALEAGNYLEITDGAGSGHWFYGSVAPQVEVVGTDLDDLAQFENITFDNVVAALSQLADFLLEYADSEILQTEIPIIGVTFDDLIGVARTFADAVDDIVNNPPQNLQALAQKIRESFGLPEGSDIIELSLVDDNDTEGTASASDMLKIALNLSRTLSEPLDVDLSFADSGVTDLLDLSLVANADLGVAGAVDAILSVGVDLDDDGGSDTLGEVFIFTNYADSHLDLSLSASAVNLFFNASLGPLGVAIIDGDANIALGLGFATSDPADTRVSLSNIVDAFDAFAIDLTAGDFDLTFPVFFPSQSDYIGDIRFDASLDPNDFSFNINTFTLPDIDPSVFLDFDLLSSANLLIEAIDLLLDTLQNVMSGEIFGVELPIIGDSLKDGVEFVEDIRVNLIDPFFDLIENTDFSEEGLADLIQGFLISLLGPGYANIDWTGNTTIQNALSSLAAAFPVLNTGLNLFGTLSNTLDSLRALLPLTFYDELGAEITNLTDFADVDAIQWDFNFSRTFAPDVNLDFDFSLLPALGLSFDGGLAAEFHFDFGFGIGISYDDGAYVDVTREVGGMEVPELVFTADAGFTPDAELAGALGFLAFSASGSGVDVDGNNVDDNNHVTAEFNVDLHDNGGNGRLSFFELGDLGFNVGFDTGADLNILLNLGFNTDLLPPVVAGIMPSLEGTFVFHWNPDAVDDLLSEGFEFGLVSGRDLVAINGVALDLGSFIGDFLGPIVSQIQEYTEPLQPIIDILTAPIPGVSDLAGRPIALVDIAAEFGEFDPSMIYAIADLISFVNSIPATTDSIKLSLGDFTIFGSGILDSEQLTNPTFDFAQATSEGGELFDVFSNMLSDPSIINNAVEIFDSAGNFLSGAFDDAASGGGGTTDAAKGILSGGFDTGEYGFAFPFLEDPAQIFGALMGRPMVLITYDLAPFKVEFTWEQSFMIYGPLWGKIGVGIGFMADFAFGYDTLGIQRFAEGNFENPLDLVAGFFISDTANPDGSGPDVPELQLVGEFSLGAELNAGIASAGIEAAIIFTANFDLNDPDGDGRVRIGEILGNFLYELNYGDPILAPVAIFDISAELAFQIRAYLKILTAKFSFEITPPITLFEFSIEFDREPILATERGDGGILLHMGPNAASRLHGNTNDIAEFFHIRDDGSDVLIWAPELNVGYDAAQRYSGDFIIGYGGEYGDSLTIHDDIGMPVFFEGGSGADTISSASSGGGILAGNDGSDSITGGDGREIIYGGEGNDFINGSGGRDLIFGDFGSVSLIAGTGAASTNFGYKAKFGKLEDGDTYRRISVSFSDKDGNDTIQGGEDGDVIFGGGGSDQIGGDGTYNLLDDGIGADLIFGDLGRILFAETGGFEILEIRSTDNLNDAPDTIFAHGGNDTIYGGGGDDSVDGGDDDDVIHGETGFDHLSGGADADTIHGGDQDDVIYGYREDTVAGYLAGVGGDGADMLFGDDNNDFIRGNPGNDTIEGGRGADIIFGDEDDDRIFGEAGPDFIFGGADNDTADGGAGNDIIFGDDGLIAYFNFTSVNGSGGFQSRTGHAIVGDHRLIGDVPLPGTEPFAGQDGNGRTLDLALTVTQASDGNDYVVGGEGDDLGFGGDGNDTMFGDFDPANPPEGPIPADEDILLGDSGRVQFVSRYRHFIQSTPDGATGADHISGNGGSDILIGGNGDDHIWGRGDYSDPALAEDENVSDEDVIIGDNGQIEYLLEPMPDPTASRIQRIATTDATNATGGSDTIRGNDDNDIILGGADGDRITGNDASDVIIGDNGEVDYGDGIGADPARPGLDFVRSLDPQVGGSDTISGGGDKDVVIGGSFADLIWGDNDLADTADANPDEDVLIGDQGEVEFDDDLFAILPTENTTPLPAIVRIETTDDLYFAPNAGMDTIEGNEAIDVILGGGAGDSLRGNEDDDIIVGDEGILVYDGNTAKLGSETNAEAQFGFAAPTLDDDPFSLDFIITKAFDIGGNDTIFGNENDDIAIGGTGADVILGDNEEGDTAGTFDVLSAAAGQDILIGDQGRVTLFDSAASFAGNITRIETIDDLETDGDGDEIHGNDLADIIIGGVNGAGAANPDLLFGEARLPGHVDTGSAGDDIIIGDEGLLRFDVAPEENIAGAGDASTETLDLIRTFKTGTTSGGGALGGSDLIFGNGGSDVAMGGTAGDQIWGDLYYGGGILTALIDSDNPGSLPGSDTLLGDGGDMRFSGFAVFGGALNTDTVTLLMSAETDQGGDDTIEGNEGDDIVMGGFNDDTLFGESDHHLALMASGVGVAAGADIILGDNGELSWILPQDVIFGRPDVSLVDLENTSLDPENYLRRIATIAQNDGGFDRIEGNGESDIIVGGTFADLIYGDSPDGEEGAISAVVEADAEVDGADGNDLIFGDHAKIYPNIDTSAPQQAFINNYFFSIFTLEEDDGLGDVMFGNGAHDIMIGGQGDDLMWGNDGDDDMIGGHNVAEGDDDLDDLDPVTQAGIEAQFGTSVFAFSLLSDLNPAVNKEFNDMMDGGIDDDVMAGDNAVIIRQVGDLSPRFRMVGSEGTALHVMDSYLLEGLAFADYGFHANIGAEEAHLDMTLVRTVYLLDHDENTLTLALDDHTNRRFGNDVMVGGLNDDEMWGQLGDDIMQGDGALAVAPEIGQGVILYDPAQDADPSFDALEMANIDGGDYRLTFSVFENIADGNDYIEGNGGSDRAYGGLGQDDIIGGSSTLFFYSATDETDRPDGADLLYGGTGNPNVLVRNGEFSGNDGDIETGYEVSFDGFDTIVTENQRHARDADAIFGDNAEIYQIVTAPLAAAVYQYESLVAGGWGTTAVDSGYDPNETIRVRAFNLVDYGYEYVTEGASQFSRNDFLRFLTTARGAGDLIYGETGDDILWGMTGNDVIFGNSEDDDLVGGIGGDFLLGGGGRDGVIGDDGLILTSRNIALQGETLHGILPLDEAQGPLKPNEDVNTNAVNAIIETPGNIQRAVINVEGELNKSVQLFAFRTDNVELDELDPFGKGLRFNDVIFGGLGQDFIHAGDGDDAVSGAEALPTYYDGGNFGFETVNDVLVAQQLSTNVENPTGPAGFSDIADNPFWYVGNGTSFAPFNPGDILRFEDRGNVSEFALYDEFFPRRKLMLDISDPADPTVIEAINGYAGDEANDWNGQVINFLLNFDETEGPLGYDFIDDDAPLPTDGDDRIFGDLGNDWIAGGTGRDHMWGGRGDDLLNMDDNHDSGQGGTHPHQPEPDDLDNTQSDEFQAYADITYGGAGRDVMILNTGADRAIDWVGEFNSYLVPFSPFGAFHISRTLQPQLPEFLYALSDSDGADVIAQTDPNGIIQPSVPDAELYVDQKLFDSRTDDPDPARNYEPFGELGLVLQSDRDWQDQTGAPSDPQPGNLQGQREIMRRELFVDDTTGPGGGGGGGNPHAITFAADVGAWSVSQGAYDATPDSVGGEAVSIHYLDQTIPNYVEILVTALAEKDKQGYNSNAFIIFDYQSATDFKFAGFDAGLDKIRIGHRTEAGWIVDVQSNMQLRAGTEYDLTLVLHGGVATIYVNGGNATSFSFNEALNTGLLGLGTDNARASFDDWQVQKLPPVITRTISDSFDADSGYAPLAGNWAVASGAFTGEPGTGDYAVATQGLDVQVFARLWVEAEIATSGTAGLAFDVMDGDNFKFAALDVLNDTVMIGHVLDGKIFTDAVVDFALNSSGHAISVSLHGGSVSIEIDGTVALGHVFASIVTDGEAGLLALDDAAFDNAALKTDDPQYSGAAALAAASLPVDAVGIDQAATQDDLSGAVLDAKSYWLNAGASPDVLAGISASQVMLADIAGDKLALHFDNGSILVDATAAGHGWDKIDLADVLKHEIGHALGLGHAEEGLMAPQLAVGHETSPLALRPAEPGYQQPAYDTLLFDSEDGDFAYFEAHEGDAGGEYLDLLSEDDLSSIATAGPAGESALPLSEKPHKRPLHPEFAPLTVEHDLIGDPLQARL